MLARQEVAVGMSFMAQTCPQIQVPSGQVRRTDSWATSLELGQVGALSCGSVSLPQPERKGWPSRTSERKERRQPGLGIPSWRLCLISKNLPDCPYFSSFHSEHHLTSFLSCRSFAGFFLSISLFVWFKNQSAPVERNFNIYIFSLLPNVPHTCNSSIKVVKAQGL